MKKLVVISLLILSLSLMQANDFSAKILLGKHHTENLYGEWTIEKRDAKSKKFYGKIERTKSYGNVYNIVENSDIEVYDIAYYKKYFLGKNYYEFFWKKKENKAYFDANSEKKNATISPIPSVKLRITNLYNKKITLLYIKNKNIFQTGGMASINLGKVSPKVKEGAMELSWNSTDKMKFPNDYIIDSGKVLDLPLTLWVKNAAHGDGNGALTYALEMHYLKDKKQYKEMLLIITQADGEGYDAGGIAPLN